MSNESMFVPKSIFEGKNSTSVIGKCSSLALSPVVKRLLDITTIIFRKNILIYFVCVEVLILVEE